MNHLLIGKKLFDQTMAVVQRSMDLRTARHKVLSSNIANVETPDYVSRDLPFQKIFERTLDNAPGLAMKKTHPRHLPSMEDPPYRDFSAEVEEDPGPGSVNIDEQMAKLAENNLMFQAGVHVLIKKFEALKTALSETR